MEYEQILNAITTVGFPIVMCAALFWYMVKNNQMHLEETNSLKEAVTKLEVAITKLCEKFESK